MKGDLFGKCESCGYATELWRRKIFSQRNKVYDLCQICFNTDAHKAFDNPSLYQGQEAMLRSMAYIGNAIISEIRAVAEKNDGD